MGRKTAKHSNRQNKTKRKQLKHKKSRRGGSSPLNPNKTNSSPSQSRKSKKRKVEIPLLERLLVNKTNSRILQAIKNGSIKINPNGQLENVIPKSPKKNSRRTSV
jgi:hypothetical protein